jgi:hypothetical protein
MNRRKERKSEDYQSETSDQESRSDKPRKKKGNGDTAPKVVAARIVKIEHAGMITAEDREHLLEASSDEPVIVVAAQVSQEWDQINLRILYDDHKFAQRFRASVYNLFVCFGCHESN